MTTTLPKNGKDEYVLKSLSKLRHKKWELYALTRIIHNIDPDIEFVCQQLVRLNNGQRALTDIYFPQFDLHLEIDEEHHNTLVSIEADTKRTERIVSVTEHKIERIAIGGLKEFNKKIDKFIKNISAKKTSAKKEGKFIPWDYEGQFKPSHHLQKGYLSVDEGAIFRTHKDVLCCFGYTKGAYQRGSWKLPDNDDTMVWFPKLYLNDKWDNKLTSDGETICEIRKDEHSKYIKEAANKPQIRITFAHETDTLGKTLYRFKGIFKFNKQKSGAKAVIYDRTNTKWKFSNVPIG